MDQNLHCTCHGTALFNLLTTARMLYTLHQLPQLYSFWQWTNNHNSRRWIINIFSFDWKTSERNTFLPHVSVKSHTTKYDTKAFVRFGDSLEVALSRRDNSWLLWVSLSKQGVWTNFLSQQVKKNQFWDFRVLRNSKFSSLFLYFCCSNGSRFCSIVAPTGYLNCISIHTGEQIVSERRDDASSFGEIFDGKYLNEICGIKKLALFFMQNWNTIHDHICCHVYVWNASLLILVAKELRMQLLDA